MMFIGNKYLTTYFVAIRLGVVGFIMLLGVNGCAVFDTRQTAQVFKYPPPLISQITINETQVGITITSDMYYPNHEDFSYYVILSGPAGTGFQTAIEQGGLSSMASVTLIPNYLTNTTKPTASGNYLNAVTTVIPRSRFSNETDYDFAVIAYGYNESYGRLYDNNGWLYSDVSLVKSIHNPQFTNFLFTNNQGLSLSGGNWQIGNTSAIVNGVEFAYSTNVSTDPFPSVVLRARGNVGINPLGLVDVDAITELPTDGYVTVQGYPQNYFPVIFVYSYALKDVAGNIYARMYINTYDFLNKEVSIKLIYTTTPNVRVF